MRDVGSGPDRSVGWRAFDRFDALVAGIERKVVGPWMSKAMNLVRGLLIAIEDIRPEYVVAHE